MAVLLTASKASLAADAAIAACSLAPAAVEPLPIMMNVTYRQTIRYTRNLLDEFLTTRCLRAAQRCRRLLNTIGLLPTAKR